MKLNGKIAVVTGASRGIGNATLAVSAEQRATRLASEGAIVAITYRENVEPAEALISELTR